MKKIITDAGIAADGSTPDEVTTSYQTIAKPDVMGSYNRFKVIAPYPGMERNGNYKVGDILTDNKKTAVTKENGDAIFACEFEKYPHLFKRLNWWDGLNLEEMPQYIFYKNEVHKIIKWNYEFGTSESNKWFFYADVYPATEKDYLNNLGVS